MIASRVGDALMLAALLKQIAQEETPARIGAGGACDTKACHATIASRGTRIDSCAQNMAAREYEPEKRFFESLSV